MKVVEAENCVLKSRLNAIEKQMEERETQSKENVRMVEEINEKVGAQKSLHNTVKLMYSLVPKESNVTLVPHITLIRPNTLSLKGAITLFWVNTKRKTVMTLIRIVLLSNGCAVITLFKIYLKRVMTDPFTFECHYSLLDHVKLKLQS